jgi:hypothetical protein
MSYIGNCNDVIDWNSIVENLSYTPGLFRGFKTDYEKDVVIKKYENKEHLEYSYLREDKSLDEAYRTNPSLEFYTYTAGKQYSRNVDTMFAQWLGVGFEPALSWISRVPPGKVAAPHIDDEEVYWSKEKFPNKKLIRYHCHLSPPEMGAAFMVEKECYHMAELGDVYQWPSVDSIHCGANAGTKDKITYHFIGVVK